MDGLENIMPRKIIWKQRTNIVCKMTKYTDEVSRRGKFTQGKRIIELARNWGKKEGENYYLMHKKILLVLLKKFL